MGVTAGQFRNRVEIQARVVGQDDWGQPVEQWQQHAICWADVRHLTGVEAAKAGAEVALARASIRIRWREGVTTAMRVLVGGVAYNIRFILPDVARREYLDLVCEVSQ